MIFWNLQRSPPQVPSPRRLFILKTNLCSAEVLPVVWHPPPRPHLGERNSFYDELNILPSFWSSSLSAGVFHWKNLISCIPLCSRTGCMCSSRKCMAFHRHNRSLGTIIVIFIDYQNYCYQCVDYHDHHCYRLAQIRVLSDLVKMVIWWNLQMTERSLKLKVVIGSQITA